MEKAFHSLLCPEKLSIHGYSHAGGNVRNTVTMYLDGSPQQILRNSLKVMAHLRLWFVSRGIEKDMSSVLGYEKSVFVVHDEGTFFLVLRHEEKTVTLIIDAREAWLRGAAGSNGLCQFHRSQGPYITHQYAVTLESGGEYDAVAPEGPGEMCIGLQPLIQAISTLDDFCDIESDNSDIYKAFGVMILSFLEPLKFHMCFDIICRTIATGTTTTLNKEDPVAAAELKKWGKLGKDIGKHTFDVLCKKPVNPLDLSKRGLEAVKTIHDGIDHIFLMPRAFVPKGLLEKHNTMSTPVSTWKPTDIGLGDSC